MLMECKIKRPGPDFTTVELDGMFYRFKPIDGAVDAAHVAEIEHQPHIDRLLSITEGYRMYVPNRAADALAAVPVLAPALTATDMTAAASAAAAAAAAKQADIDELARAEKLLEEARANDAAALAAQIAKEEADAAAAAELAEAQAALELAKAEYGELSDEGLADEYKRLFGKAPAKTAKRDDIIAKIIAAPTKD